MGRFIGYLEWRIGQSVALVTVVLCWCQTRLSELEKQKQEVEVTRTELEQAKTAAEEPEQVAKEAHKAKWEGNSKNFSFGGNKLQSERTR